MDLPGSYDSSNNSRTSNGNSNRMTSDGGSSNSKKYRGLRSSWRCHDLSPR